MKKKNIIIGLLIFLIFVGSVAPLPAMAKEAGITQQEWDKGMQGAISVQTDMYKAAIDIESVKYPLRNLFYMGVGIDYIEQLNNKNIGKGKFMVKQDGFGFLPIVCYDKVKKCIILGVGENTEVMGWMGG
jgi:hypothetical protein